MQIIFIMLLIVAAAAVVVVLAAIVVVPESPSSQYLSSLVPIIIQKMGLESEVSNIGYLEFLGVVVVGIVVIPPYP